MIVNESNGQVAVAGQECDRKTHSHQPEDQRRWPWMTVIGVVANIKRYTLTETPRPELIVPYTQNPYLTFGTMQFVIRSNLETSALLTEVQRAMAAADPTIPLAHVRTIEDLVATSASNARFATRFMAAFGVVAPC